MLGLEKDEESVSVIKNMYRWIFMMIHSGKSGNVDPRGVDSGMRVLSRAMDLLMTEKELKDITPTRKNHISYNISQSLLFYTEETETEYMVRSRFEQYSHEDGMVEGRDKYDKPEENIGRDDGQEDGK